MARQPISRRRLLTASAAALATTTGCVADPTGSSPPTTTAPADDSPSVRIASLTIADFVLYPLSGTHPHVHRQDGTQYVILRLTTASSVDAVRDRLTLEIDGRSMPLAERQPVPWTHDTVDVAFAIPKTDTFDGGRVLFDGAELRSLSASTIERLNNPPVFTLDEPSVSPTDVNAGEQTTATVRFELANTGDGRGTFGASLAGNFISGAKTVTATLDADTRREITATVRIIGRGDAATVWLDWGVDQWAADIPVVGTPPGSETPTAAPTA